MTPAVSSRGHRRSFSTDTGGPGSRYTRQIEGPEEYSHRASVDRGDDYRAPALAGARKGYHLSGPLVRHPDVDGGQHGYDAYGGYGYGNTDPEEDFYRDPPVSTRRRGDTLETPARRERPLSMVNLENYPPRGPGNREPGPYLVPRTLERSTPMAKSASADRRINRNSVEEPLRRYDPLRPQAYEELPIRPARQNPVLHHEREAPYPPHRDDFAEPRERRKDRERIQLDHDYEEPYTSRWQPPQQHHHHQHGRTHSVESSPYHSADLSSDPDEGTHRRPRRHRHREEALATVAAVGAGGVAHDRAARDSDGRGKPSSGRDVPEKDPRDRDVRDRDRERERERERDRERRERRAKDNGTLEKPSRSDRERRDRDPTEREARKRETREREDREQAGRDRDHRERRPRDRNSTGGLGEETPIVDLRDRQPRERDPRDREQTGEDNGRRGENSGTKQKVRVVSPPREKEKEVKEVKGILRQPREKFPEDPEPVREGVAPLKEALKDGKKGIPPGARWTKVDRKLVNPAALDEAQERYEERIDHVIVLRVLTREEIEKLAARTQEIRGMYTYVPAATHVHRRHRLSLADAISTP